MGSGHGRAVGGGRLLATGALTLASVWAAGLAISGTTAAGAATGPQLTVTPSPDLAFPPTPVGQISTPVTVKLTNTGSANVLITRFTLGGADVHDFLGNGNCFTTATTTLTLTTPTSPTVQAVLLPGQSCTAAMLFLPGTTGPRTATLTVVDNAPSPTVLTLHGTGTEGYYLGASDGGVFAFGNAPFEGSTGNISIRSPVSSMAATPFGYGYWLLSQEGGIFSYGTTAYYGAAKGPLNAPVINLASTATGIGYWQVAGDGGVFAFGTAPFYGSMGGKPLDAPIVGIAAMPSGGGYYEVASDGGIFAFGDAPFRGSMGGKPLDAPIVGMAVTPTSGGYYEVASDGGIFAFGNARFHGSMGGKYLDAPMVGMAVTPTGGGYWTVASDGGVFAFGSAPFYGSMGGKHLNDPMVDMASTTAASLQQLTGQPELRARIRQRLGHPGWRFIRAG